MVNANAAAAQAADRDFFLKLPAGWLSSAPLRSLTAPARATLLTLLSLDTGRFELPGVIVGERAMLAELLGRTERTIQLHLAQARRAGIVELDTHSGLVFCPELFHGVKKISPQCALGYAYRMRRLPRTDLVRRVIDAVESLVKQTSSRHAKAFRTIICKAWSLLDVPSRRRKQEGLRIQQRTPKVVKGGAVDSPPRGQLAFAWSLRGLAELAREAVKGSLQGAGGEVRARNGQHPGAGRLNRRTVDSWQDPQAVASAARRELERTRLEHLQRRELPPHDRGKIRRYVDGMRACLGLDGARQG